MPHGEENNMGPTGLYMGTKPAILRTYKPEDFQIVCVTRKGCVVTKLKTTEDMVFITTRVFNRMIHDGFLIGIITVMEGKNNTEMRFLQRLSSF